MRRGAVRGLGTEVSRVVLGTAGMSTDDRGLAFALLDAYAEEGGNCIDTAWVYGLDGSSERVVGEWLSSRGGRGSTVLIGKGACTTSCTPELVSAQLTQSLDRLGVESVDLYLLHRDNPSVPVGEFVEALNEELRQGRMSAFGGSNWSTERLAQAERYARSHGLVGFTASSANLSLARWNEPAWPGTVTASDPAAMRWYREHDIALFAWSSQAGGFFGMSPAGGDRARVWLNEDNLARRERAVHLAERKAVSPTQIALAYVLWQPFTCFGLVGPRSVAQLRSSIEASRVMLSPEELVWLETGSDGALRRMPYT